MSYARLSVTTQILKGTQVRTPSMLGIGKGDRGKGKRE